MLIYLLNFKIQTTPLEYALRQTIFNANIVHKLTHFVFCFVYATIGIPKLLVLPSRVVDAITQFQGLFAGVINAVKSNECLR